jgi:hypothetical protein
MIIHSPCITAASPVGRSHAMSPNSPLRPLEPETFHALVEAAARQRSNAGARLALDAGVDLQGLCRFAAGALSATERRQVEAQLATTTWATSRVAALLRGARGTTHGALARGVLEGAKAGRVDVAREVGRALLREANRPELLDADDVDGDDPRVRGGHALARGRYADACLALTEIDDPSPLSKLAARVAQMERDPDAALMELLELI